MEAIKANIFVAKKKKKNLSMEAMITGH